MKRDFLIVGGGLAGSLLAWELRKRGRSILLIDDADPAAASRASGGVVNPVTGWRMVRTWLWDALRPAFEKTYREIEQACGTTILREQRILTFYPDGEGLQMLQQRSDREEATFLHGPLPETPWHPHFNFHFGIGEISPAWTVDVPALLAAVKTQLVADGSYLQGSFSADDLSVSEGGISWREVEVDKVIFCGGAGDAENPLFPGLPITGNKGEAIIARIADLPRTAVFRQGLSLVPWGKSELWWVGTTHELNYADTKPTAAFRQRVEAQLRQWLRHRLEIVDQLAGARPTTADRRPILGTHPLQPALGIFNGLGTKGCSMAPYFAGLLAAHLCDGTVLDPGVDVGRFGGVLRRMSGNH